MNEHSFNKLRVFIREMSKTSSTLVINIIAAIFNCKNLN